MHNYSVGSRYATKTKLGNWYEESELCDYDFKEYLYKKNQNQNISLNNRAKLGFSQQAVQISTDKDGMIYYGDKFMLGNPKTKAILSYNINESILGEESYAVTTCPNVGPALRNVFLFQTVGQTEGPTVKYGDKFRIVTHAGEKLLYLQSISVSPMRSSKFSRNQQVSVTSDVNSNTIWSIEHISPKLRFDAVGEDVRVDAEILLKHVPTAQWLATDLVNYVNEFGSQYQVFAKSYLVHNKTQNLFSEKVGHKSAQNVLRGQGIENSWRVLKNKE